MQARSLTLMSSSRPQKIAPLSPGTWQRQRGPVSLQFNLRLVPPLVELHTQGNLKTSMEVRGKPSCPLGSRSRSPCETWNWRHPKAFLICVPGTSRHLA